MSENIWKRSALEFKKLRVIVVCGMMGALGIVLDYFGTIRILPYVRIGLADMPNRTVDYLFGPVVGCIFGGAMDIIKFILHPDGTFFIGYTLSAMAAPLIFGAFTYRRKLSIWRVLAAEVLIKVFVNLGMNTLWSAILYQKAIMAILPARIISNVIQLPVDTIVIWLLMNAVTRVMKSGGISFE